MTVAEQFAKYACSLRTTDLPDETLDAARRCLLDWLGATIAGGVQAPATQITSALPAGSGASRLIPSGQRRDPRTAALINGTAAHIVEVDDIFRSGLYHPGAPTIAAALAAAEHTQANGLQLLKAIVAGYEVSNRIARTVGATHYEYWHMTATVGYFGAATASSFLLGLSQQQTGHAIAQSATWAAGLKQAFASDAMSKPIHSGRAAEGGLAAAMMASAGVTAVLDMLEGARGFGKAMAQSPNWADALGDLNDGFTIEQMTVKYHACCGHTFAAIDGALELASKHALTPDDIVAVRVATYSQGVEVCGNPSPVTPAEARFSLPYTIATAITNLAPCAPSDFEDLALANEGVRGLMERIAIGSDEQCDTVFPAQRSAFVTIETRDGRVLKTHRPTRKGDPDDPLSREELDRKFESLTEPVLGKEQALQLAASVWQLSETQRVSDLPFCASANAQAAAE